MFLLDFLVFSDVSPRKGPPRFLTEGHMSMTKSGFIVFSLFIVFSCLGLLS